MLGLFIGLVMSVSAHAGDLGKGWQRLTNELNPLPRAEATCTRYCDPAKSKPCGKSCISKYFTCRTSWTTACSGKRTSADEPGYENPTKIEPDQVPKNGESKDGGK